VGEAYTNKRAVESNVTMNYADKTEAELRAEIPAEMGELGLLPENPQSAKTDARADAGSGLIVAYPAIRAKAVVAALGRLAAVAGDQREARDRARR
jgi:hypothetical protein